VTLPQPFSAQNRPQQLRCSQLRQGLVVIAAEDQSTGVKTPS